MRLPPDGRRRIMRILIGSPVHQKPEILALFLQALERLEAPDVLPDYLFVDDNDNPASSQWLYRFCGPAPGACFAPAVRLAAI